MSRSLTLDLSTLKIQPTSHTTDLQKDICFHKLSRQQRLVTRSPAIVLGPV